MTFYRSPDLDSSGAEPSYASLAARLKKLPTYQHPNAQALLDKLERGEMDSEECLHELTQDAIRRTEQQQAETRTLAEHDTQQQQALQQQRQQADSEMARNAASDEPTIVPAGSSTAGGDAPGSAAPPPAPAAPTTSSGGGGLAQTPPAPETDSRNEPGGGAASEYNAGFIPFQDDAQLRFGDDDERGDNFEN